jgi:uncharacterized membrane protein YbhN (UPF0104 family)
LDVLVYNPKVSRSAAAPSALVNCADVADQRAATYLFCKPKYRKIIDVNKKHLFLVLKILIALVVFGLVGWELYKSWGKIQEIPWKPNYLVLTLAGICYAAAFIPAAIYWRYALQTLGQKPDLYETFRAYYIGHLGKYVPGKVMVLIIRSGLLNRERTKITAAGASVFLETMTMMAVGGFVAAAIGVVWFGLHGHRFEHGTLFTFLTLGFLCCTVLPILPPVFNFAAKKCRIEIEGLRFRTLAFGWMLNIPVWFMLGISLWLTMTGLGFAMQNPHHWIFTDLSFCTLAISGSIVVGFASMLPGGFGSRELALIYMLTLFFTTHPVGEIDAEAMAIAITAVQRLISILSELAVSAVLCVNFRLRGQAI